MTRQLDAALRTEAYGEAEALQTELDDLSSEAASLAARHGFAAKDLPAALLSVGTAGADESATQDPWSIKAEQSFSRSLAEPSTAEHSAVIEASEGPLEASDPSQPAQDPRDANAAFPDPKGIPKWRLALFQSIDYLYECLQYARRRINKQTHIVLLERRSSKEKHR